MLEKHEIVAIGAGHNALVAAAYMACASPKLWPTEINDIGAVTTPALCYNFDHVPRRLVPVRSLLRLFRNRRELTLRQQLAVPKRRRPRPALSL